MTKQFFAFYRAGYFNMIKVKPGVEQTGTTRGGVPENEG